LKDKKKPEGGVEKKPVPKPVTLIIRENIAKTAIEPQDPEEKSSSLGVRGSNIGGLAIEYETDETVGASCLRQVGIECVDGKNINRINEFFGYPSELSGADRVEVRGTYNRDYNGHPISIADGAVEVHYLCEGHVSSYRGSIANGVLERGVYSFNNGEGYQEGRIRYEGDFENNRPKGPGVLFIGASGDDGDEYEYYGPCMDGLKNGRGKITRLGSFPFSSDYSYECNFENGVETLPSKTKWVATAVRNFDFEELRRSAMRLLGKFKGFFRNATRCEYLCNRSKLTRAGEDIENSDSTVGKDRKGNWHQK
jgi:hypothetical protein